MYNTVWYMFSLPVKVHVSCPPSSKGNIQNWLMRQTSGQWQYNHVGGYRGNLLDKTISVVLVHTILGLWHTSSALHGPRVKFSLISSSTRFRMTLYKIHSELESCVSDSLQNENLPSSTWCQYISIMELILKELSFTESECFTCMFHSVTNLHSVL